MHFQLETHQFQTVGDICSIAVDMDNKKMWLGINGEWSGGANPSDGYLPNWDSTRGFTDGDTYMPVFMSYGSSGQTVNFGQKPSDSHHLMVFNHSALIIFLVL